MTAHGSEKRKLYSFAIDRHLLTGLRTIKALYGIPESEQIRRGIALWLTAVGVRNVVSNSAPKGSATRALKQIIKERRKGTKTPSSKAERRQAATRRRS